MNTQTLVAGIDGSPASGPVLRYALDEAIARGYSVRVVTCWSSRMVAKYGHGIPSATTYELAVTVLNSVIHQVATSAREVRLIVTQIDEGEPGPLLVNASKHAVGLVLGSPHRGLFTQFAGHKTAEFCIRHSQVPVMLIPWEPEDPDEDRPFVPLKEGHVPCP